MKKMRMNNGVNGLLQAKKMSWSRRYKKYYKEVVDYEIDIVQHFAFSNAVIFFVYALFLWFMEIFSWRQHSSGYLFAEGLSFFACLVYLLHRYVMPKLKEKKWVRAAGIGFIALWVKSLLATNLVGDGTVSWSLLLCSIVTTSMLCIVPTHYATLMIVIVLFDMIEYLVSTGSFTGVLYNLMDDVIIVVVCISVNVLFAKRRFQDFERKEMLMGESSRDPLTQLYNRRYLERYFMRETQSNEVCALVLLDLDNFKAANDLHGHKAGDDVLRKTGNILRRSFRESDCVARIGGDEFAVYLPKLPDEQLVIHRVQSVLRQFPIVLEEGERTEVSVSIGITCRRAGENTTYEQLCDKADVAMYSAKRSGKAQAFLFSETSGRTLIITAEDQHEYRNGLRIAQ